jgi:HSP20 family molecular chaperone IbpA
VELDVQPISLKDVIQMPHVTIEKPHTAGEISALNEEQSTINGHIRVRAFELFEKSGEARGHDAENWVRAEDELLQVPHSKLESRDGSLFLRATIHGHHEHELKVVALPNAFIIIADAKHGHSKNHLASIGAKRIFQRIDLHETIDTQSVHAEVENGFLKVTAKML